MKVPELRFMNLEPESAGSYVDKQGTGESSRLNTFRLHPEDIKTCLNLTQEWDISLPSHLSWELLMCSTHHDDVQLQSLCLTQRLDDDQAALTDTDEKVFHLQHASQKLQQFFTVSDPPAGFFLSVILIRDNPVKVLYCRVKATTWIQTHSSLSDPSLSSSEPRGGCWLTPVQSAQQRSLWLMQTAITTRCCSLFSRLIWCGIFLTPIRRPWLCAVPPLDGVAVLLRFSFLPVQREWMLKCCRRRCYDRPSWGAPSTWGVYRSAGSDGFVPRWKKLEHQNRINLRWVDNGVRC